MTERAELAGHPGTIEQIIEVDDLPESFEWKTDSSLLSVPIDEVASQLTERIDDPKGAPLALPDRSHARDVLVEIATVRREGDELLAVLRERSGTGARTAE